MILKNFILILSFLLLNVEAAMSSDNQTKEPKNVYGEELKPCCFDPLTGYFRDGYCRTVKQDVGTHVICAEVTDEFLKFTLSRGNNLIQPSPQYNFPGLKHGDKWCLCALRWKEALENNVAPPVDLDATDVKALDYVSIKTLEGYSLDNKKINLDDYKWNNRVILLFADDRNNKQLRQQLKILEENPEGNNDRDIKILRVLKNSKQNQGLFNEYDVKGDFQFILIGKDGGKKLRNKAPVLLEKIYEKIDAMPMRKLEMIGD